MEWFKGFIQEFPVLTMAVPSLISAGSFIVHLVSSLSDGVIDANELNTLLASANGIETIILVAVMYALKK